MTHRVPVNTMMRCQNPGTASFGSFTAVTGRATFAAMLQVGQSTEYFAVEVSSIGNPTGAWESGFGLWNGSTLSRSALYSSNSNAVVSFTGTVLVMLAKQDAGQTALYWQENDFLSGSASPWPFAIVAISSGTTSTTNLTSLGDHIGVLRLLSSATANSGVRIGAASSSHHILGGEIFRVSMNVATLATATFRLGLHNSTTSADATNGTYIEIASTGVCTGKTMNASTGLTTGSTYTISTGVWYTFEVVVSSDRSAVTFSVLDDLGAALWSATLSTNLPATSALVAPALVAPSSGTTAISLVNVDRMGFGINRKLSRSW